MVERARARRARPAAARRAGARLRRRASSTRCACCATGSASQPAERPLFDEAVRRGRRAAGGHLVEARRSSSRPGTRTDEAASVVLRAPAGDRRGEPAGHDRRPRHRVPARPARVGPPRALGAARAQGRARAAASARGCATSSKWAQNADRPGARPRRRAARVGRARRPARARARDRARAAARAARAPPRARARRSSGAGLRSERFRNCSPPGARSPTAAGAADDELRARRRAPIEAVAGDADPQGLPAHGPRRGPDRRRQPARGAARAAQARQGAALPARAVRQPVPDGRRQADGLDAQGPAGGARALPGPRGADRACCDEVRDELARSPTGRRR